MIPSLFVINPSPCHVAAALLLRYQSSSSRHLSGHPPPVPVIPFSSSHHRQPHAHLHRHRAPLLRCFRCGPEPSSPLSPSLSRHCPSRITATQITLVSSGFRFCPFRSSFRRRHRLPEHHASSSVSLSRFISLSLLYVGPTCQNIFISLPAWSYLSSSLFLSL